MDRVPFCLPIFLAFTPMTKSVGYIRVSTDKQDFERQRDEITDYAQRNDFHITKFFEDKHTGSDYKDRKGFQELLQYLEDHPDIQLTRLCFLVRLYRK